MSDINELFQEYEQEARDSFDQAFVNRDHLLAIAEAAQLCDENKQVLRMFLDDVDADILFFIWHFYYLLFCTDEDFSDDIWQLDSITMPEETEQKHPGCIKAVLYLLAVEHLKEQLKKLDLPETLIDDYYSSYRGFVRLNLISPGCYGLCRLSAFLYGYAKPFILHVGRLNYQLTKYKDYCEMYENSQGDRIFVALPTYGYDASGLRDDTGRKPQYIKNNDILTAHTFDKMGRLRAQPEEIDLTLWHLALKPGDIVWTIHIPGGKKLDQKEVLQSLSDAAKLFKSRFPAYKAFVCHTWFIDPGLRDEVIMEGSNMAAFADLFDVISGPDNQNHSVYEHVFQVRKQPLENLIPKNDFQSRVLKHALAGKKIYWSYGVLKKGIMNT